ncbi:MAG: hypothetical protein V4671_22885 [Armatimonadota bacterium]
MQQLNKKQFAALWIGFSAIVLLLLFPPPGEGQTEWPVFVYSSHQVVGKRQPNGQFVTQYGWERPDLADLVRLPIIVICTLTAGAVVLSATPKIGGYPSDPSYRPGFTDPRIRDPRKPRKR